MFSQTAASCPADQAAEVLVHAVVEVLAADALGAAGQADDLERGLGAAHHAGVEGAAAEVVDGDVLADLERVVDVVGGGDRLGAELDPGEAGLAGGAAQHVDALGAPAGRVGQDDVAGLAAVAWPGPPRCGGRGGR